MSPARRHAGIFALCLMAGASTVFGQTPVDNDLKKRSDELLVSYAAFKKLPSKDPAVVLKNLSEDRRAVFDSIIRALFVRILDDDGNPGPRVIDLVDEVRGIWGVRKGLKEGRFMFRMSMRFNPKLKSALEASSNIPKAINGHVLLPIEKGGDDDPAFTGFDALLTTKDVVTFRAATPEPKLQISLLKNDPRIGEVDIDYDGVTIFCKCHCRPSNSDPGSHKPSPDTHVHLTAFNIAVAFFSNPFAPTWSSDAHCKETY
jgi:hypothetical protein